MFTMATTQTILFSQLYKSRLNTLELVWPLWFYLSYCFSQDCNKSNLIRLPGHILFCYCRELCTLKTRETIFFTMFLTFKNRQTYWQTNNKSRYVSKVYSTLLITFVFGCMGKILVLDNFWHFSRDRPTYRQSKA